MNGLRAHGAARIGAGLGRDPGLPPDLPDAVREAIARADLSEAQAHLAWELARLAPGLDEHEHLALLAVVLITQEALAHGSTRVLRDPARLAAEARALGFEAEVAAAVGPVMERAERGEGSLARLFGAPGDRKPLIVDGEYLYQERLLALEMRLAELLAARVARAAEVAVELDVVVNEIVARPAGAVVLTDEQREAVRAALRSPLTVVSGGPGTGKTSIVVAILRAAVLAEMAPPAGIALAAPTGKAADRMRRSIEAALASIEDPLATDRALRDALPRPMTLHRLLGWSPSRGTFRHRSDNPLAERLVIVDESSMIDVFLMERLASSVLPDARLVLLGDAEQLPSVAAGAVFRDLGRTQSVPSVVLTKSHRMDPTRPDGFNILSVAASVNRGELPPVVRDGVPRTRLDAVTALTSLPRDLDALGGVFLYEPAAPLDRERFLDLWFAQRIAPCAELAARTWPLSSGRIDPSAHAELEPLFAEFERARLLCMTRSAARPTGVLAVNASLHRRFADARRHAGTGWLLAGEPVLVHRNDYERGLFNGDQGIVLFTAAGGESPRPSAVFRTIDGFAAHPIEAVRASVELGFATTVHKAQGSEHDSVALLLPETDSPRLLTREILYTAITRARRSVLMVGSAELLARAVARRIERSTGIAERLAAASITCSDSERPPSSP